MIGWVWEPVLGCDWFRCVSCHRRARFAVGVSSGLPVCDCHDGEWVEPLGKMLEYPTTPSLPPEPPAKASQDSDDQ